MKIKSFIRGSVLMQVIVVSAIILLTITSMLALSQSQYRREVNRGYWCEAYYAAENALLEGAQRIADVRPPNSVEGIYATYTINNLPFTPTPDVSKTTFKIEGDPMKQPSFHLVTASSTVSGKARTISARVQYRPPSQVFDYEYFLNNWGWWWGNSITGNGDNRSNWDFDYKDYPTMNGNLFSAGSITKNGVVVDPFNAASIPFNGWAKNDPVTYIHTGSERLKMPNLNDLSYYEKNASGTIMKGADMLASSIHGDNESKTGLYLDGTDTPIVIDGTIVIRGDVIIKGRVTGRGTLYVGGNLYLAGNVQYANSPVFGLPSGSETMTPAQRQEYYDNWASVANDSGKDLIAYGVKGQILAGSVNDSTWKSKVNDSNKWGLKNIGSETLLGQDGIRWTSDDNIKYLDTNGDGTLDSSGYDADSDGNIRSYNYNYDSEIKMTTGKGSRADKIQGYPVDSLTGYQKDFTTLATNSIDLLHGILYTNHAIGLYTSKSMTFGGALICRDEAINYSGSITFNYDWRVHSRNHHKFYDGNGNKILDLNLPIAYSVRLYDRQEIIR